MIKTWGGEPPQFARLILSLEYYFNTRLVVARGSEHLVEAKRLSSNDQLTLSSNLIVLLHLYTLQSRNNVVSSIHSVSNTVTSRFWFNMICKNYRRAKDRTDELPVILVAIFEPTSVISAKPDLQSDRSSESCLQCILRLQGQDHTYPLSDEHQEAD